MDEDEVARLLQAQGMEINVGQSSAQNGLETYEDFSDDSFDAGGFDDDDF